ncbi:MAG: repressor LexA, partial [Nitrospinota bacterium]
MYLTRRQREIFEFIRDFIERRGYSPSIAEIGESFGLSSPATVHKHLQNLASKGLIRRDWNRSRAIELVEEERAEESEVPLLGLIAAGEPIIV